MNAARLCAVEIVIGAGINHDPPSALRRACAVDHLTQAAAN